MLRFSVLIILLSIASSACGGKGDRSFLEGTPCAAPCWQGITPGVTDGTTALAVVKNPALVKQASITLSSDAEPFPHETYRFERVADGWGEVTLSEGIVSEVRVQPGYDLSLGEVVDVYDAPDFIQVYGIYGLHRACYSFDLFYVQKGISIHSIICDSRGSGYKSRPDGTVLVDSEMETGWLVFFVPGTDLMTVVSESLVDMSQPIEFTARYAVPWTGFGFYALP